MLHENHVSAMSTPAYEWRNVEHPYQCNIVKYTRCEKERAHDLTLRTELL